MQSSKVIAYCCPYVPSEWIAAHGLAPLRAMPHRPTKAAEGTMGEGLCPYVHAMACWAEEDRSAAALVLTTLCDQMRRGAELIGETCGKQVFLLNLPKTWQGRAPVEMYISELLRLGRFLERMGGEKPSDKKLADTILEYSAARSAILSARSKVSARVFSQLTAEFPQGGLEAGSNFAKDSQAKQDRREKAVPLAIVGGPMLYEDLEVLDVAEQFGGRVVLDATDTGERAFPSPADERNLQADPLGELARVYFGGIAHAFRRPNTQLYDYLSRELAARTVRGIIFRRHTWCDTWHVELARLRGWADLPVLDLDGGRWSSERTAGRVQVFLEILR